MQLCHLPFFSLSFAICRERCLTKITRTACIYRMLSTGGRDTVMEGMALITRTQWRGWRWRWRQLPVRHLCPKFPKFAQRGERYSFCQFEASVWVRVKLKGIQIARNRRKGKRNEEIIDRLNFKNVASEESKERKETERERERGGGGLYHRQRQLKIIIGRIRAKDGERPEAVEIQRID